MPQRACKQIQSEYQIFGFIWFCFLGPTCTTWTAAQKEGSATAPPTPFHVGVLLDLETWNGIMCRQCIEMAVDDFHGAHDGYSTRLVPHIIHAKDTGTAALKAIYMLQELKVQVIIGPQRSAQTEVVAVLGNKSQVPVVSISASSPSVSRSEVPYFIRMAQKESYQVQAIASLVKFFQWKEVVLVHEETDYENEIIRYLIDEFQTIDVRVPYRSSIHPKATDGRLLQELDNLSAMKTRVFIVHIHSLSTLGSRFFELVRKAGLMAEGNAWITTEGLTNFLSSMDYTIIDSMQGVLGIKSYIPRSKELFKFKVRMSKKHTQENGGLADSNIFCLHAYDTIWALSMAAEIIVKEHRDSFEGQREHHKSKNNISELDISEIGPPLLKEILKTNFRGLSGQIRIIDGQLPPPIFQIINVYSDGEIQVGFWNQNFGISQRPNVKTSEVLGPIIWPGESSTVPKGYLIQASDRKRRIGFPVKNTFTEFVVRKLNSSSNATEVTGYCIEVFKAVMEALPYDVPYEFVPFQEADRETNVNYDDIVRHVFIQKYDAVVGDITITANRSLHVEFSQPYTTGGVEMVIPIKHGNKTKLLFIFRAFSWGVWISCFGMFAFIFVVIWSFERPEALDSTKQIFESLIIPWKLLTAPFAEIQGVKVVSKYVGMIFLLASVVLFGLFVQILSMSITDSGQLTTADALDLARRGEIVGYQKGSFVKMILMQLNFNEYQLRAYNSLEEYDVALSKGSQNGGVAAVFDEIPYIKLFLNNYCEKYRRVGPTYRMEGFGFAFPRGSPLVRDVSTVILSLVEDGMIQKIESTWLGPEETCSGLPSHIPSNALSLDTIWGLFAIVGLWTLFPLLLFMVANTNRHSEKKILKSLRIIFQMNQAVQVRHSTPADDQSPHASQVLEPREQDQDQREQDEQDQLNTGTRVSSQQLCSQEQNLSAQAPSGNEELDESDPVQGHPPEYATTA